MFRFNIRQNIRIRVRVRDEAYDENEDLNEAYAFEVWPSWLQDFQRKDGAG